MLSRIRVWLPVFRTGSSNEVHDPRPVLRASLWVIAIGFFGFMIWAALTPIARGAHVMGHVIVESSRKVVQHREGGIVRDLRVQEGQFVQQGDVLLVLDGIQAKAGVEALEQRLARDLAAHARLQAEVNLATKVDFPKQSDARLMDKYAVAVMEQADVFMQRRLRLAEQLAQADARVAQLGAQIASNAGDIAALEQNLAIQEKRVSSLAPLVNDGLYARNQYLDLELSRNRTAADLASKKNETTRLKEALREAQLTRSTAQATFRQEAAERLSEVRRSIAEAQEQMKAVRDVMARTQIVAPASGQVVNLTVHTIGGVVSPGQTLMSIVPSGERLVIEAQVNPLDIDAVHAGMPVEVKFSALPRRTTPMLVGKLMSISRDVIESGAEQAQGPRKPASGFYLARIEVPETEIAKIHDADIIPGMPVEVLLKAGERTALEYLVAPWSDLFYKAMREE